MNELDLFTEAYLEYVARYGVVGPKEGYEGPEPTVDDPTDYTVPPQESLSRPEK